MQTHAPEFLCDAMLGGLARWLRAAGYDAEFARDVDDSDLIHRALRTGATLLSSDGRLFERNIIRHKTVKALFIPRELSKAQQLAFVVRELALPLRPDPRCMACGGELAEAAKNSIRDEAPARAFAACDRFWRCTRCAKLLWNGSHWRRIAATLDKAAAGKPEGLG